MTEIWPPKHGVATTRLMAGDANVAGEFAGAAGRCGRLRTQSLAAVVIFPDIFGLQVFWL